MTRSFHLSLLTGTALAMMMIMAPGASASPRAATPSPSPNAQAPVQQGTDVAALPGATAFGDTPPSTPETVSFIMREQNLPQLKAEELHQLNVALPAGSLAESKPGIF